MYVNIKKDDSGEYVFDSGYTSEDDGDEFYRGPGHTKIEIKADVTGRKKREQERYIRYHRDPILEEERRQLKKKFKSMCDLLICMNRTPDKVCLAEAIARLGQRFVKHPNSVYLKNAIGKREYYTDLKIAIEEIQHTDILLVVDTIFVKCADIKDCEDFVDALKNLKANYHQLLMPDTLAKLTFILRSTDEDNIDSAKEMLVEKLQVKRKNITIEPILGDRSIVVVSAVTGLQKDLIVRVDELRNNPPKGFNAIASLIENLPRNECLKSQLAYYTAALSREFPYNYHDGKEIKIVLNLNVNGGICNVFQGPAFVTNTNNGDTKMTEEEKLKAEAIVWISRNPPKEHSAQMYYDAYSTENPNGFGIKKFTWTMRSLGYESYKRSNSSGKKYWRKLD